MSIDGKRLAIMQPYIFPYIGYFQLIAAVDQFVIFDDVNFIKRGWINRNRLLSNGEPYLFTIPVSDASQNLLICNMRLSLDTNWQKRLLKTIELNYKKATQFETVYPLIKKIIFYNEDDLSAFIMNSLKETSNYLGMGDKFVTTSRKYRNRHLQGQSRILDICQQEGAKVYVNPAGGLDLYEQKTFSSHNIKLQFLQSISYPYPQRTSEFIGSLSIIDVLMWNDRAALQNVLDSYTLI